MLRPRDAAGVYAFPGPEFMRLSRKGLLRRLATGYYVIVPQRRIGDRGWTPDLHAAALGIAITDYGRGAVALIGTSAARVHGAIPRAVAVAVVAIPTQRPPLSLLGGKVVFVQRRVESLDVERLDTELVTGWVTTVEQTLLDLAHRPTLGGLTEGAAREAIQALDTRADWTLVRELAGAQRKAGALRRAYAFAGRDNA